MKAGDHSPICVCVQRHRQRKKEIKNWNPVVCRPMVSPRNIQISSHSSSKHLLLFLFRDVKITIQVYIIVEDQLIRFDL